MSDSMLVPDGWDTVVLNDSTVFLRDGTHGTHARLSSGVPLLSAKNITKTGTIFWGNDVSRISLLDYEKIHSKYQIEVNDVLITVVGTLGRSAIVKSILEKFSLQRSVAIVRTISDILDHLFFGQLTRGDYFQKQLVVRSNSTAQAGVYLGELGKIKLTLPPLPEQKKIASILTSVDDVIEKTEAQIIKLQDLKKGLMTELLSKGIGHTEFKDSPVGRIPVEWEVKRLEDVVDKKRPITYGIVQAGQHIEDGVPYIRVSDMTNGKLSTEGMMRTSRELAKKFIRSEVKCGDIVYALRGKIGLVMVVPETLSGANLTQGTARIASVENINTDFLLWTMRSPLVLDQSEVEAKGSTFQEITLGKLKQLWVTIPPIKEQIKIASIFNSLEKNIESKENKLSHAKSLKKALMNDLLTGKIRV